MTGFSEPGSSSPVRWFFGLALPILGLIPLGAWIQWDLPGDCPCELTYLFIVSPLMGASMALLSRGGLEHLRSGQAIWCIACVLLMPALLGDSFVSIFPLAAMLADLDAREVASYLRFVGIVLAATLGLGVSGWAITRWMASKAPASAVRTWFGPAGVALLLLIVGIQVLVFVPEVGRRIGPWAGLRSLLVQQAARVAQVRRDRGIPDGRLLTSAEVAVIESRLGKPMAVFTFPLVRKSVSIRIMQTYPPYVGVDYGDGRNCVFDLSTMRVTYAD